MSSFTIMGRMRDRTPTTTDSSSPWQSPRARHDQSLGRTWLPLALILITAGADTPARAETAPPPGVGAVQVEQILSSERDLGRRRFLRLVTGQRDRQLFSRPYGVAWDGDALVVTDPGSRRVVRIDSRKRVIRSPEPLFESPIGVAVCAHGTVVTDSAAGAVALVDQELHLVRWIAKDLDRPTGVACRGRQVFVVETGQHRILVLDTAAPIPAKSVRTIGRRGAATGELNFPTTIAVDAGSVWAGDILNFRLQRFDADTGEYASSFGQLGDSAGEMPRVKGVAIDEVGRLWVTDALLDQLALYSREGVFLMSLGRRGTRPGEFSFPAGISIHEDGRIAVADSLNRRIQILRLTTDNTIQE